MSLLSILIGIATGVISGFGIGGGSLLVLYLTAVSHLPQQTAGGINLLYFIGCAPIALIGHTKNRYVEWRVVLWCSLAGTLAAIAISFMTDSMDPNWLRRLFGILLLYVGIKELRYSKGAKNK